MATPPIEEKGTSSKSETKTFDLAQLDELLLCKDGGKHDLKLKNPRRRLIHQGSLNCKSKRREYRVFLLDHVLIIAKPKVVDGREQLRMVDHPIPIQLLRVSSEQTRPTILGCIPLSLGKNCHLLRFSSLGKRFNNGKALTLLSPTAETSKAWVETVNAQRSIIQQSTESNLLRLGQDVLMGNEEIRVNCAALYDNGQSIAYGTGDGVYLQPPNGRPRKAVDLTGVRQIDVLEDLALLVVLAERSVFTFPLDALDQFDRMNRMCRISNGPISFFKVGTCMARTMVCLVKTTSLSSTVKILERIESPPESNPNRKVQTLLPDNGDKLKMFK
ncbi:RHO1 GDP-GTP exchange protein 2, partial [Ceratobasidium sp. 423]